MEVGIDLLDPVDVSLDDDDPAWRAIVRLRRKRCEFDPLGANALK